MTCLALVPLNESAEAVHRDRFTTRPRQGLPWAALDGIADFDWSNVTAYINTVTSARRGAETSVLTAQLGFVTSYYGALNSYTSSMAAAGISHATG